MGCDIHASIEAKLIEDRDFIMCVARDIKIDRWYELFNVLAGVRGDGNALFEIRRKPNIVSDEVREEFDKWEGDAHTYSWITFRELKKTLPVKYRKEPFYIIMEAYSQKYGFNNVRIVFFFDN